VAQANNVPRADVTIATIGAAVAAIDGAAIAGLFCLRQPRTPTSQRRKRMSGLQQAAQLPLDAGISLESMNFLSAPNAGTVVAILVCARRMVADDTPSKATRSP
jgi:hypothetical protein